MDDKIINNNPINLDKDNIPRKEKQREKKPIPIETSNEITLRFVISMMGNEFDRYSKNRAYSDIMDKIIAEILTLEDDNHHILTNLPHQHLCHEILYMLQELYDHPYWVSSIHQIYETLMNLNNIITYPTTHTNIKILLSIMDVIKFIYGENILKIKKACETSLNNRSSSMNYIFMNGSYDYDNDMQCGQYSYKNVCKFIMTFSDVMMEYSNLYQTNKTRQELTMAVYNKIALRLEHMMSNVSVYTPFDQLTIEENIEVKDKFLNQILSNYSDTIGIPHQDYMTMVNMVYTINTIDEYKSYACKDSPLSMSLIKRTNKFFM